MSWPSTVTVPSLKFAMPQMIEISVVLPAPFGPSSAKISPRLMSRSTPFSALNEEPYVFDRFLTEMIGGIGDLDADRRPVRVDRSPWKILQSAKSTAWTHMRRRERPQRGRAGIDQKRPG